MTSQATYVYMKPEQSAHTSMSLLILDAVTVAVQPASSKRIAAKIVLPIYHTCPSCHAHDTLLYWLGLGGLAARVPMAARINPTDLPVTPAADATITETQVLSHPMPVTAQSSTPAASHTAPMYKAQLMQQQASGVAASSTHTLELATAVPDAAALDNGKKRKAEAEALQLAQAAAAVVINAGKRRASPEAEVGFCAVLTIIAACAWVITGHQCRPSNAVSLCTGYYRLYTLRLPFAHTCGFQHYS